MTNKENNFAKDINVPSKEQIIIDTNKYFVELIDEGGGTVDYTVMFPERLLIEIIKQNKQLARKTQECEELKEKLKFKVQENIKLSKENRNLKNWAHSKGVEIKVNRKIKETNLEEFCRMFRFKEMQAREEKLKEWQDFENDLQWKFYKNCKEWTEMRDKYNRYRKALEEIEEVCRADTRTFTDGTQLRYDSIDKILDIINKAKRGS